MFLGWPHSCHLRAACWLQGETCPQLVPALAKIWVDALIYSQDNSVLLDSTVFRGKVCAYARLGV